MRMVTLIRVRQFPATLDSALDAGTIPASVKRYYGDDKGVCCAARDGNDTLISNERLAFG